MFKKIITLSLCILMTMGTLGLTGCSLSRKEENEDTTKARANDYEGGYTRATALEKSVLALMDDMKQNNSKIREKNPNSFWLTDGYQDFVTDFMHSKIADDTCLFNEERTKWDDIVSEMEKRDSLFTEKDGEEYHYKSGVKIKRNEKDDYSITNVPVSEKYSGMLEYHILYDCDKDWAKATSKLTFENEDSSSNFKLSMPSITYDMFEYARLTDDTFAIQTAKERLYIVFESVDKDTDISDRKVKEFYYSRLTRDGARTTFTPYKPKPEADEEVGEYNAENAAYNEKMSTYPEINEKGDFAYKYGENESIFKKDMSEITPEWVFEDKSLQQAIIYKGGNLVVTTYNKISQKYERFIYSRGDADEKIIPDIEGMVNIKNLVGVQEVKKTEAPKTKEKTDKNDSSKVDESSKTEENSSSETDSSSQSDGSSQTDSSSQQPADSSSVSNSESKADETSKA